MSVVSVTDDRKSPNYAGVKSYFGDFACSYRMCSPAHVNQKLASLYKKNCSFPASLNDYIQYIGAIPTSGHKSNFWGWLFQFGTDMDIVEPQALKEAYKNRAAALL